MADEEQDIVDNVSASEEVLNQSHMKENEQNRKNSVGKGLQSWMLLGCVIVHCR